MNFRNFSYFFSDILFSRKGIFKMAFYSFFISAVAQLGRGRLC